MNPTTTAVRQPQPSVSQKMETRKAGMAMSKSARFIFFLEPLLTKYSGSWLQTLRLRAVRRRRHIRLPDCDAGNFRAVRRLVKLLGCLIVNVARDIFSRWVQHVERRKLVQIFMVQRPDHGLDYLLQVHEIVENADGIDFLA